MFHTFGWNSVTWSMVRYALRDQRTCMSDHTATALRTKKAKSRRNKPQHFVDARTVRAIGGKGGDGAISFLQLWSNETAGPDGGDGGNGGHVVFKATQNVQDLRHLTSVLRAQHGEKGYNKDCHGKSADHTVIQVPIGTIIKSGTGKVVGDLKDEDTMFVAARGGAGGHGNHFFISDTVQAPKIAECGAEGEELQYVLEVRSMAHIGLIGFPNAGKSTLLQAVSRAQPKIAPYPFTTLKPHLGVIQYDDYDQVAVADLPGLIPGSHLNRGLGIQFLKHAERCAALLFLLDLAAPEPWTHLEVLQFELSQFNPDLLQRPQVVVGNKLDLPEAKVNLPRLQRQVDLPVIAVSAKMGTNLEELLKLIKEIYDKNVKREEENSSVH